MKKTIKIFYNIFSKTVRIRSKRVLFISYSGKTYSDNPKAVSQALHELDKSVELVWVFNGSGKDKSDLPEYIITVDRNKPIEFYKALASSKVLVSNMNFREPKRKGQRFLQLWHGDRAFKRILFDSPFHTNGEIMESKIGFCDLAVAGSEYGVKQFRSGFHYSGEILTCGTPRDDVLVQLDSKIIDQIKRKIGINKETRILLYAPTLRREYQHGRGNQKIQDIDLNKTLDKLEEKYSCSWVCLMRAHPVMSGLTGFDLGERIQDVSSYEDMADLLLVSDMLITDYSSCAGDFALTHRPIVLYQSDRKEYIEKDRTFYFDMEDSPYMIAENQQKLEDLISSMDDKTVWNNCEDILRFYNTTETGEAAITVAKRIMDWLQ